MSKIRTEKGLSLKKLEALSGVSRTQLWRIENGLSDPTLSTMRKIARALKSDIWDVFEEED